MNITCSGCLTSYNLQGPPGKEFRCRCGNKVTIPQKEVKDLFGVVYCSACWTRYAVAGRTSGAKFKCKRCDNMVTIRNTGTTGPEAAVGAAAIPALADNNLDNAVTQVIDSRVVQEAKAAIEAQRAAKAAGPASRPAVPASRPGDRARVQPPPARPSSRTGPAARRPSSAGVSPAHAAASGEDELQRRVASLERELAELRPKTADLEKERNSLTRTLKEKDALVAAKDAEIAALNSRVNESQALIKNSAETISSLQGALANANRVVDELKGTVAARDRDIAGLKEAVAALEQKAAGLSEELKSRATREETDRFYADKKAMEDRVEAVAREIAATREALRGILGKADALSAEIRSLQNQAGRFDNIPDISKELSEARAGRDAAIKERDAVAAERDELKQRIDQLEAIVGEMQRQIDTAAEPKSVWRKGAALLSNLFSRSSDTQVTRAAPSRPPKGKELNLTAGDVVPPDEVQELGDDIPVESVPITDDELLGDSGKGAEEVPQEGVDVVRLKTNVLPRLDQERMGAAPPRSQGGQGGAQAATARKRRRFGR